MALAEVSGKSFWRAMNSAIKKGYTEKSLRSLHVEGTRLVKNNIFGSDLSMIHYVLIYCQTLSW